MYTKNNSNQLASMPFVATRARNYGPKGPIPKHEDTNVKEGNLVCTVTCLSSGCMAGGCAVSTEVPPELAKANKASAWEQGAPLLNRLNSNAGKLKKRILLLPAVWAILMYLIINYAFWQLCILPTVLTFTFLNYFVFMAGSAVNCGIAHLNQAVFLPVGLHIRQVDTLIHIHIAYRPGGGMHHVPTGGPGFYGKIIQTILTGVVPNEISYTARGYIFYNTSHGTAASAAAASAAVASFGTPIATPSINIAAACDDFEMPTISPMQHNESTHETRAAAIVTNVNALAAVAVPIPMAQPVKSKCKYCVQCGKPISSFGAKFCSHCGTSVV